MEPQDPPDWIISHIWILVSSTSADILLAKVFLILAVSFVVKNNSCGNSSCSLSTFF